jgi:membrane protease YdiL (CAAX protease family)
MSLSNHPKNPPDNERPSFVRGIFYSPEEPRLRTGWRISVQILLMLVFYVPIVCLVIITFLLRGDPDLIRIDDSLIILQVILALPASLLATWIARRKLDHRSFRSLGFTVDSRTAPDLILGFLIPAGMMGAVFLLQLGLRWIRLDDFLWNGINPSSSLLWIGVYFFTYLAVGFYEELLFRGYYLLNLRDGINLLWAVILTSIAFGLGHLTNPNSGLLATLLTAGAGFFLAFAWFRTGSLWLPISLHAGWNFFLGPIFGFPVSGLSTPSLIRQSTAGGPDWLSGGAYGPEGGLITLVAISLGMLLVWFYTRGRQRKDPSGSDMDKPLADRPT